MHTSLSVMTGSDDSRLLLLMTASAVLIETSQACLPAPCFWPLPLPFPFLRYRHGPMLSLAAEAAQHVPARPHSES